MEKSRYTLLELTGMIGKTIGDAFPERYWLIAEINEMRENINGHCYLELIEKDQGEDRIVARSRATIWAYTWRMLKPYFETSTSQPISKGMMILVEVSIEFHELYGISLNIKDIDPLYTMGDLERKRAETIRKLKEEGIIDMNRELPFPLIPSRIAIISSPLAAGYEDFTHQVKNNPLGYHFEMRLFAALMQGENAGRSVTKALDEIFEMEDEFDVVVILRGGGSASDLNCFDSYDIASHIAQFPLPVITGIGHERDHTIAGMVAHTNLKTPTAVAEFLIGKYHELDQRIGRLSTRIAAEVSHITEQNNQMIKTMIRDIPYIINNNLKTKRKHLSAAGSILTRSATGFIRGNKHKVCSEHSRFGFIIKNHLLRLERNRRDFELRIIPEKTRVNLRKKSDRLGLFDATIKLVDPENVLKKGYALVMKNGGIVKSTKEVNKEDTLETKLHDGRIKSKVLNVNINQEEL
ncbi:MAG: exodeoxyribonuclease VII large subunit [Bacteroidales bacterium]